MDQNPADYATCSLHVLTWLQGPEFLARPDSLMPLRPEHHKLLDPDQDDDVRPQVPSKSLRQDKNTAIQATRLSTRIKETETLPLNHPLEPTRFERFSRWRPLVLGVAVIVPFLHRETNSSDGYLQAERGILRSVQQDAHPVVFERLKAGKPILNSSPLLRLNPFLDSHNLLRV